MFFITCHHDVPPCFTVNVPPTISGEFILSVSSGEALSATYVATDNEDEISAFILTVYIIAAVAMYMEEE